jgi:hypothetical protein
MKQSRAVPMTIVHGGHEPSLAASEWSRSLMPVLARSMTQEAGPNAKGVAGQGFPPRTTFCRALLRLVFSRNRISCGFATAYLIE